MKHLLIPPIFALFLCFTASAQFRTESSMQLSGMDEKTVLSIRPIGRKGLLMLLRDKKEKSCKLLSFSTGLQKEAELPIHVDGSWKNLGLFANEDSTSFTFLFVGKSSWFVKTFDTQKRTLTEETYKMLDKDFVVRELVRFKDKMVISGLLHWRPRMLVLDLRSGIQDILKLPNMKNKGNVVSMTTDSGNKRLAIFFRKTRSKKRGEMNLVFMDADGKLSSPFFLEKDSRYVIIDGSVTWIDEGSFVLAGTYGLSRFSNHAAGFFFSRWENYVQQSLQHYSFSRFEDHLDYLPEDHRKIVDVERQHPNVENFVQNTVVFHPVYAVDSGYRLICEVYYRKEEYVTTQTKNLKGEIEEKTEKVFVGYEYTDALVLDLDEKGNKIGGYCFPIHLERRPRKVSAKLWALKSRSGELQIIYAYPNGLMIHEIKDHQIRTKRIEELQEEIAIPDRITNNAGLIYWYGNSYLFFGNQMSTEYEEGLFRDYEWVTGRFYFVKKVTYTQEAFQ